MAGDQAPHPPAGTSAEALPAWPFEGRFEGREAFAERIRQALAAAAREGWRELFLCDENFEDWPLGERGVIESLSAWSRGGRRMLLLATSYEDLKRRHHRFVHWRQTWDHLIEARACRGRSVAEWPSALWAPVWSLQRLDLQRSTGGCSQAPERRLALRETLDECWRRGSPAFPASTLGL